MKASELMIGNYVNTINGIKKVSDISIDRYCWFISDKCEPIVLSEEWLLNFGFEKTTCDEMTFIGKYDCFYYRLFEGHIEWNGNKIFIKYVHQLQNIYFALTGQELTLNH